MTDHKVAIVTGGATGIGREIAFHLARTGAAVAVDYVGKSDQADKVVSQIEKSGGRALAVQADVSLPDAVQTLVSKTVGAFGRLDILINNAGIEKEMPFWDVPTDLWQRILAVNLSGPFFCAQAAAKQMIQQNPEGQGDGGRIINISSVHEDMPMPTNAAYCASKGGLRMLMRTMAVELAPHKITVNNIGPGAIDTPLDKPTKDDPQKLKTLLGEILWAGWGSPRRSRA